MIERYTLPRMGNLWSLEKRYKTWLAVELAHLKVLAREGIVPKEAFEAIQSKAKTIDWVPAHREMGEIEKKVKHDVIAFLTYVGSKLGPDARYLHFGLTSSDLLDTSFALLLKEASQQILLGLKELLKVLKQKAFQYKGLVTIGRTHGMHAETTSFGLKFALWYAEMTRNYHRVKKGQAAVGYGKFSGAVGNFAYLTPEIEEKICRELGLNFAPVSTQIIQRDRHAEYFSTLAILAGSLEKIALELRHLQRTEVGEVEEPFSEGQKGSSAMPHKKNPIGSENLAGLSRLVRANAGAALENIALWHERDISHSSVERVIAPDSTILVDFMIHRLIEILKDLIVHEERVRKNAQMSDGIYSQRVLLALTEKGISREEAYRWMQRNAFLALEKQRPLLDCLMEDRDIRVSLSDAELRECFSVEPYLRHLDEIYKRVFDS